MDALFGIAGLIGVIVCVVLLFIAFIRKTTKNRWIIGLLVSVLFVSFGIILGLNNEVNYNKNQLNTAVEELDQAKSANEKLTSDLLSAKISNAGVEVISQLISENTYSLVGDDVVVFVIPIEGNTTAEISENAINKHSELVEFIKGFAYTHSVTNKTHFYFKMVDENMNTILEYYLKNDGKKSGLSVGTNYLSPLYSIISSSTD